MINKYQNESAYKAAGYPSSESRVAKIESTEEIKIDGVNVITGIPSVGDAVYHNGERYVFVEGGEALNHSAMVVAGFTAVGCVIGTKNGKAVVVNKNSSTAKYLDVCQYAITAISSTMLAVQLRMAPDYSIATQVDVELTSTNIDATTAAEISAAVAAKATAVGDTNPWWAYLADANGDKVDSDGTQIIVQCDVCTDYRFYNVSATGCTIANVTWGDMPANSIQGVRHNNLLDTQPHLMNIARGATYYGDNGITPAADVALNAAAAPVTKTAFDTSAYCILLRAVYITYENYLKQEYQLRYPQRYGLFQLPDAAELSAKYANLTAPTKAGSVKYKFPALRYGAAVGYAVDGLTQGSWHLCGVDEGILLLNDINMSAVNKTLTKMGITNINNSSYRWFAERNYVTSAWLFYGNRGSLTTNHVPYTYTVQAYALLNFNN